MKSLGTDNLSATSKLFRVNRIYWFEFRFMNEAYVRSLQTRSRELAQQMVDELAASLEESHVRVLERIAPANLKLHIRTGYTAAVFESCVQRVATLYNQRITRKPESIVENGRSPLQSNSVPKRLYLMQNERNGLVKIGISSVPAYREATLQSEEPEIRMLFACAGDRRTEKNLHNEFAEHRVRGEWFRLNHDQVESIRVRHG